MVSTKLLQAAGYVAGAMILPQKPWDMDLQYERRTTGRAHAAQAPGNITAEENGNSAVRDTAAIRKRSANRLIADHLCR